MPFQGRVVLFVEGSLGSMTRRGDAFLLLWQRLIPEELGLLPLERVVPIDKRSLVTMDPALPAISGAAIGLDELIRRELDRDGLDLAIVAWDLVPPWNPTQSSCRWDETLSLYGLLANSDVLPQEWRQNAADRHAELLSRPVPAARAQPVPLQTASVIPICMEPMFEALLLVCEEGFRRALGVQGRRVPQWPSWAQDGQVDRRVIQQALLAARALNPRPPIFRRIRGDFLTRKHEWAEYLLRTFLEDEACRELVLTSPIARRLIEVVGGLRAA